MFCSNCGNQLEENANFCSKCGQPVDAPNVLSSQSSPAVQYTVEQQKADKKSKKPMLAIIAVLILLVIVIIGILSFIPSKKDSSESEISQQTESAQTDTSNVEESVQIDNLELGNIVTFGSYEQDNNLDNGKEPIEWDVIAEADGYYQLISHYILDAASYSLKGDDGAWESSNARSFLNDDFYNAAFTDAEKELILPALSYGNISDNVFLLTISELPTYFDVNLSEQTSAASDLPIYFGSSLICGATPYAKYHGHGLTVTDLNDPKGLNTVTIAGANPEYITCAAEWMLAPDADYTNLNF
jgi:hypothetical protein